MHSAQRRHRDPRTCLSRLQTEQELWAAELPALVKVYMQWKHGSADGEASGQSDADASDSLRHIFEVTMVGIGECVVTMIGHKLIYMIDTYIPCHCVTQRGSEAVNIALACIGYLGCTPVSPGIAISFKLLELYHQLRQRKSSFSTQVMAKVICAIHNVS